MTTPDAPTQEHWPVEPPPHPPGSYPPAPPTGSGWGDAAGPAPSPPASGGRRGLLVAIVAVGLVLALAAGTLIGIRLTGDDATDTAAPPSTTSTTATTEPSTTAPSTTAPRTAPPSGGTGIDPAAVEAEVADLQSFVEQERGLPFLEPVPVEVLEPDAFTDRVLEEFRSEADELSRQGRLLQALGLVPADLDVTQAQEDLLGSGVLGFYDPTSKELVVRGEEVGPFFREIVVHELTHALDDQHFDLDRPELADRADGSDWAFLALVEGNARRVEYAYVDQLTDTERSQLTQEQLALSMDQLGVLDLPLVLPQILMAPYDYGAPFVDHLLADGGQPRLDAAFGEPPTTSEQIVEPPVFDAGEGAAPVATPPADAATVDEGVLGALMTSYLLAGDVGIDGIFDRILNGEVDLGGLLGDGGGDGELGSDDLEGLLDGGFDPGSLLDPDALNKLLAPPLVEGWGGDRYVVWDDADGSGSCVRVDWVMDSPAELSAFEASLRTWATTSGATVEDTTDGVRMTRCS